MQGFQRAAIVETKKRTSQLVTHEGVAPREEHSPNLAQDLDLLSPWPPFSEDSGQSRRTWGCFIYILDSSNSSLITF